MEIFAFQYKNGNHNTDHLRNIKLSYTKDPQTGNLKILDESHYYPFGLKHQEYQASSFTTNPIQGIIIAPVANNPFKYKYNGKEFQDELGLNFYDYGARNYDPAIGRFFNIDNYAEDYRYINPYQYTLNNPVYFVDVNGDCIDIHYGKGQVESFCGDINSLSDQALQNDFVQTTVASYLLLKFAYSLYNTVNRTDYQSDFVNLVENGDVSVGFKHSSGKNSYYFNEDGTGVVYWNPDGGVNSNGHSFSSFVVLEHEGSHANNHQTNTGLTVFEYYRQTGSLDGYGDKYNGTFYGDTFRKSPNSPDDNYEEDINAVGAETKAAKVLGELPKETNRTRAKYKDGVEANNGFMKNKPLINMLKKQIRDTQPKNKQDVQ